ncbi:MAG: helix-turn-helix transcriptional regulator [Chloroflexi bacterium]|nr:helix-turn-helix transcriptional regulator [Chloroflexota bacterium]
MENKHIGSDFDNFLAEEGLLEQAETVAVKRVIAYQVEQLMKQQNLSKTEMSRRMNTSRAALERLLDPANQSVTLQTLDRAARALGKRLQISLA